MKNAYEFKALIEILKGKGLEVAEESAEVLFDSVMEWVEESAKLSATPYDNMAMLIMPQLKEIVKKQIDKIDKKEG